MQRNQNNPSRAPCEPTVILNVTWLNWLLTFMKYLCLDTLVAFIFTLSKISKRGRVTCCLEREILGPLI